MKNTKILVTLLFSIILLASVISAANVTITTPAASATIKGVTNITVSIDTSKLNAVRNCSIFASSSLTANSSLVNISLIVNTSANSSTLTGNIASTVVEDANNYVLQAFCKNETGFMGSNSSQITGIIFDNTNPTTPSSLSPAASSSDTDGTINFTATVDDASTTSCILFFPKANPGAQSYAMSYNTNICYYNLASISQETYDYRIQASDESNLSNSTQTTFDVRIQGSSNYLYNSQQAQDEAKSNQRALAIADGGSGGTVWWILGVLALLGFLYWIFKR